MKPEAIALLCSENYDQSYINLISNLIDTIRLDSNSNFQTLILILLNHKEPYVIYHVLNILRQVQLDRNIDRLLSPNFFNHLIDNLLRDEDEYVRQEAALLIHAMALKKPHHKCTCKLISNNSKIPLIDLVFLELCEMINDIDLYNRILACELLGACALVSQNVIMQTLSKESILLNSINVNANANSNPIVGTSDENANSTGTKNETITSPSYHINWSSRGAFVHGLEDEFESVRSATIKAMFSHILVSSAFATKAIDMIIDAFNDDSESTRLLAARTLHAICLVHKVKLEGERLNAILSLVDDGIDELREAMRLLLQKVEIESIDDILTILSTLHRAIQKYPQDIDDVIITASKMAQYNSFLILNNIPDHFIKIERFFLIPEPKIEDYLHQIKLVMILNVIKDDEILPEYVFKQYMYLRLRYPEAIPDFYRNEKFHERFYASCSLEQCPIIEKWNPNVKSLYLRYAKLLNNPIGLKILGEQLAHYQHFSSSHLDLLMMLIDQKDVPKDPRLCYDSTSKDNRLMTFIWPITKTELDQIEMGEFDIDKPLYHMKINLKIKTDNQDRMIEGIIHQMNPIVEFSLLLMSEAIESDDHDRLEERIAIKPEFDQIENIWKFTHQIPSETRLIRFYDKRTDMDLIAPLTIN